MNVDMIIGIALGIVVNLVGLGFVATRKDADELDSKAKAISIMYLTDKKTELEVQLNAGERPGDRERFAAEHDISCLERTITFIRRKG